MTHKISREELFKLIVSEIEKELRFPTISAGIANRICNAIEALSNSKRALPPPAGESVTFPELARWMLDNLSLDADHEEDADKLLSTFNITRKSEARS